MSEIILPPGLTLPKHLQQMDAPKDEASDEEKATSLPEPKGWKLLCVVPDVVDTFDNSDIVKADAFMKQEEHATTALFVYGGPRRV